MSLISKTVMMRWNVSNKKWYELKGYKYTKLQNEFKVKVEDLTKATIVKVQVKCDVCGTVSKVYWSNYKKRQKDNGLDYCNNCKKIKSNKTKLGKGKSFYQWCTDNNRQDVLDRWNYELNKCSPNDIGYATNKKYWFKCLKHKEHTSEIHSINNFTNGHIGSINCKQCNSFAQWGIDNIDKDFLEKYWNYNKNILNPWEISYSSAKKIWIKCQKKDYHGSYQIRCADFTYNDRCPYCSNKKVHPKDSLGQYIIDNYGKEFLDKIWSSKNKKSSP